MEGGFGILTLVPPLVAIVLCFLTKRVLVSLFMGILAGGIIMKGGNPFTGIEYSLDAIVGSITDDWNARLLLFNLLMGSGVAFIWKLGGSRALTKWAKERIKSRKAAGVGAWALGVIVFFNDYVNAAMVGGVFRDICDENRISSERLSYILDSTAAPVATLFLSDWIAFQISMVQSGLDAASITDASAFSVYIGSIPYNIYCILSVFFVLILILTGKDYGPMLKAEHRTMSTGKLVRDGGAPMMDVSYELGEPKENPKATLSTFFVPLIALVGVTLFGFWWTGRPGESLMEILGNTDAAKALLWGAFAMTLTGIFMSLSSKLMDLKETMDTFLDGFKLMLLACGILVLAWSLGSVTGDMKLADYIITLIGGNMPLWLLPIVIFAFGMVISFATGTSWGTMTILTPIAVPLAYKMTGDITIVSAMAGVVFSGAIFGDHCSPISDTTVLASIFSGADHIDHVTTQIPYAITVAAVSVVMYLLYGIVGIGPVILLPLGMVILYFVMNILSNYSSKKYGIDSITKKAL
ncbi:MAG: Na+/H+ antiporter NhaC family protein [Anaeromicrobium sp.]|jgi:Na+/H+ antiporter NhaC|uniref:Na+/H+ antiporter NhaC family protein n=1 Tax=Anaeromicrobium sp. TaxID=1929132 RepID=UPI0025FD8350|nr:Na+/H+ antiporter NhaC family protein [Anaeromicrobium sp.]MCT4595479.1 Na+/H+ antiporter NhaC family protein [Anaeromicrobium sp.]